MLLLQVVVLLDKRTFLVLGLFGSTDGCLCFLLSSLFLGLGLLPNLSGFYLLHLNLLLFHIL